MRRKKMSNSSNKSDRENFGSRIGFIMVSAGCAIGIGNVWKFPYLCGEYGGAAFILLYLIFLVVLGVPVMISEFSIGRASGKSAARAFEVLEPKGSSWHHLKWISIIGCHMLMMYYTTVAGWMFAYCFKHIRGEFVGKSADQVNAGFSGLLGNTPQMVFWTVVICVIGFAICYLGLQNGVERITKWMMSALLILMIVLAVHSVFLEGAGAGIRFYLIPDFGRMQELGIGNVIYAAMSQAFFTLSLGVGAMLIFGSYLNKDRSLTGEAVTVASLDTFVALMAGFIIIPACFAYGVEPGAGPSLIFLTIPNLFTQMMGGRIWGTLFFVFLSFAAMTTVVAVFENIIAFYKESFGWDRKKSVLIGAVLIILLSMPCVLGYNVLSGIQPLGEGSAVLDFEDFIVSNNLLPLGSLAFILFCTSKNGWSWKNFIEETDQGKGMKFPQSGAMRIYVSIVVPIIILAIYFKGYYDLFKPMGTGALIRWMCFAILLVGFVFWCALYRKKK